MQTLLSHGMHLSEELQLPVTQSNFPAASTVFTKVPPDHAITWVLTNFNALSLTVNCKPIHSVSPLAHPSGLKSLQITQKDLLLPSLLMVPKSMQAQALSRASHKLVAHCQALPRSTSNGAHQQVMLALSSTNCACARQHPHSHGSKATLPHSCHSPRQSPVPPSRSPPATPHQALAFVTA